MSDTTPREPFETPVVEVETPVVEVKVYRHGELVRTQLCDSADEAAALVTLLEEAPGTECTVEDLSAPTHDESGADLGDVGAAVEYPNTTGGAEDW